MKASPTLYVQLTALFVLLCGLVGYHYATRGLHRLPKESKWHVPAARPELAPAKFVKHGCTSCHAIPGVPGADGKVGPKLDRVGQYVYLAGVIPMSPQNLVYWIENPKEVDPRTAMPDLGVSPEEAADIAAYLYAHR